MFKKLKNKIKSIQNKPEKTKIKIIWILAIFCMIIIAIGWYISLSFNKNVRYNYNQSIFSSFPDLQKEISDIDKINTSYKTLIDQIAIESEQKEIEEIAKNYIEKNNYLKNGNVSDLKLKNIEKWKNNWRVKYEQYYENILVNESDISFIINNDEKKITSSSSNFDSDVKLDITKPEITKNEAYDLIVKTLKNENLDLKNSELIVYKDVDNNTTKYYLTWKINIFSLQPIQEYIYFVNAENGKIISFDDMIN